MPPATKVNGCRPGVIGRGVSALALALGIAFAPTAQAFSPQPVLHLDASAAALGAAVSAAIGFVRNKVVYKDFAWQVYTSPHFEVHYYPEEEEFLQRVVAQDAVREGVLEEVAE